MPPKRRVDAGLVAFENESAGLLSILLKIREVCVQKRSQSVDIDELCSGCVSAAGIERICERSWIDVAGDGDECRVYFTDNGEAVCSAALNAISPGINGNGLPRPHWDPHTRELVFEGRLLKRFPKAAPNQECLLDHFEQLGWPKWIEDSLPKNDEIVASRRLRETIKQLNPTMNTPGIRFRADGTGCGVTWINTSTRANL